MIDKNDERTLLGSDIRLGHCVIVNEFDRPCARLIAVIDRIEDDFVWCRYLSTTTGVRICVSHGNDVTPIERFGIIAIASHRSYRIEAFQKSNAKYKDGSERIWQELCATDFLLEWTADRDVILSAIDATTLEKNNAS